MTPLVEHAITFATLQHSGQYRKHGDRPYIYHPEQVYLYLLDKGYLDMDLLSAAWLHDVVEDCNVSYRELENRFGGKVAELVREVSHVETPKGYNRKLRWELYLEHYAKASQLGRVLKLADRVCNLQEYVYFWNDVPRSDRKFLDDVYLFESDDLLEELWESDVYISNDLRKVIDKLDLLIFDVLVMEDLK